MARKKLKITLDKLPGLWYINHRPGNYNYYDTAYTEMEKRFNETCAHEGYIDDWMAWCENANHDNCDWKIFEMEVK